MSVRLAINQLKAIVVFNLSLAISPSSLSRPCPAPRFGGLSIDVALRAFLAPFRLPGEAQKIDRLMEVRGRGAVTDRDTYQSLQGL
jgi:hypothetical protein